jgi:prefoldin subunit 5
MREGALSVREQLEQRVGELRAEQQKGQQMLAELEAKQAELRQTLLRISGAIQVLEELLAGRADDARQNGLVPATADSPPPGS